MLSWVLAWPLTPMSSSILYSFQQTCQFSPCMSSCKRFCSSLLVWNILRLFVCSFDSSLEESFCFLIIFCPLLAPLWILDRVSALSTKPFFTWMRNHLLSLMCHYSQVLCCFIILGLHSGFIVEMCIMITLKIWFVTKAILKYFKLNTANPCNTLPFCVVQVFKAAWISS